jgi:tetratricopeptide (TPR) repeat protein
MSQLKSMLREANDLKQAGNEYFAKGQYDEAIAKYEDALFACPERNTEERAVFFSNIAACQMKQVNTHCTCFFNVQFLTLSLEQVYRSQRHMLQGY